MERHIVGLLGIDGTEEELQNIAQNSSVETDRSGESNWLEYHHPYLYRYFTKNKSD